MRLKNDRLFVFSGLMFAGKDYVAKKADLEVRGFADPIYEITESLCGTRDKAVPGVRKMMQTIGQWGWGCVTDEYPLTITRSMLTRLIRTQGREMTKDFKWVDWSEYGKRKDFWVNILLTRLGLTGDLFEREDSFLFPSMRNGQTHRIGITNARFEHELNRCKSMGFEHFHIRCTEDTRRQRMIASGYEFDPKSDQDLSELMAFKLDACVPDTQVIWNDFRPMPNRVGFLTVDDFIDHVNGQEWFDVGHMPNPAMVG
jgi:hypothetical protein